MTGHLNGEGCFVEHYPPSRLFYLFPFSDFDYHTVYTKICNSRIANLTFISQ
nr:MAG TPA: hypothetical protein [Caudoviricetes sp.]